MERRDNIESNQIQQKNHQEKNGDISELNKYKYVKRSSAFEYDCISCGDKISFKLTFDLMEEIIQNSEENINKKPKQFISINAKPFANRNNFTNKEEYVYGIKKSFTLSKYREKFNYIDFQDNSTKYSNLQESNLINVYNDMIKSIKEKNTKIIINKYHLVFIYYLHDFSNLNNLIILILDNENEFDILECYENANQKVHKIKNKNNNKEKNKEIQNQNAFQNKRNNRNYSKSPKRKISKSPNKKKSKSPNRNAQKSNSKQNLNNDDKKNNNNNKHENKQTNSKSSKNKNNSKNNNEKKSQEKEDKIGNGELDKNKNSGKTDKNIINTNSNNDKKRNQSHRSNSPITQNETNKKLEKRKEKKEKECQKEKEKEINEKGKNTNKNINRENNESLDNSLKGLKSPTKAEKERITKNFLYGEYNFSNFEFNNDEQDIRQKSENSEKNENISNNKEEKEKDEESDWNLSIFDYDEEEEKGEKKEEEKEIEKNKNNNKNENEEKKEEVKSKISESESKKEDDIFFDFDKKNKDNNNKNNLIGKKINREDSQEFIKGEKSPIKNFQKEKKNNDYMDLNGELIKKDLINNPCSIITISESDDENNNNLKITSENKNNTLNKSKIYNDNINVQQISKNKNEKYISFDQNFSPQINNNSVQPPESPSLYSIESDNNELSNIYQKNKDISDSKGNISNYDQSLLKYLSFPSQIIEKSIEIKKLKDKIEKHNDLYLKLIYTSARDKDDYSTFKNAVMDKYRLLILVKTTKGRKFALYFNEKLFSSKDKINQEIIDMMGFVFSFEKYKFYVPTERLICFTRSPPAPYLFKLSDYSIYIKNNFKNCKHHFGDSNKVFSIKNISEELNEGEREYDIDILEVYRAEIPNK